MPAGLPYFAWIDASETTFTPAHLRWDENIFSFTLQQSEGDPASLTVVVRRPRNVDGDPIGLLGPGRKIWCWFAFDCGPDLVRFRGRLVGVPTSIFEELVTLEFVARPIDLVAQKIALADSLRVLPHYDETVIEESRRSDPEVVLEGYTKIWHYDRESHVVTVSDEITGEDGNVEFDGVSELGKVLWDGLQLTLTSGPLASVEISAEYAWTQIGQGSVDLTRYLIDNWTGPIGTYTFGADNWPKNGASLGDGWVVAEATAIEPNSHETETRTAGGTSTGKFPDDSWFGASTTTQTTSETITDFKAGAPGGAIHYPEEPKETVSWTIGTADQGFETGFKWADDSSSSSNPSLNYSYSQSTSVLVRKTVVNALLKAGYSAGRQCTEKVSLSLFADLQPILTDPEDGESLRIDDIKSVNLSEPINGVVPIGDPRRRSYIATDRGNQSLEHLIALARANLMKRARVVEIAFAPKLERMPEVTLRKNAFLIEPRIGEALGKVIGYSLALDGSNGRITCEIRIGCAIGRGGSAVASGGEPTYCEIAYTGADYQQFTGRIVLFDSSVGYQPPNANPNDDGINFLSTLRVEDVIDIPLVVEYPASEQAEAIAGMTKDQASEELQKISTRATFKLKSMTREFSSDYDIEVTNLSIPTGYDLEAV
jgi:hypothetical protein